MGGLCPEGSCPTDFCLEGSYREMFLSGGILSIGTLESGVLF